ncbi:MAG: 4Fe-4S dicluster domain-containing protein [Candidatus Omnitrophica bacterium]|nr:4Fe-4S dicluster domain-containing protein [Candidatus Omnitrophota bacterium]
MKWFISHNTIRSPFQRTLEKDCGEKVSHCYQCGKCSAGCPIAFQMDFLPNQIIRMTQLGMEQQVLSSRTIWLCASCLICTVRCPREIDIAEIMDYLRRQAYKKGIIPVEETEIPLFNKIFLRNIELFGRLYEMGLIGMFNLLSGEFFKDVFLAPKMFLKQKISVFPPRVKNIKETRIIFRRAGKLGKAYRDKLLHPRLLFLNLSRKIIGKIAKRDNS